ncbi:methylphosphotriester-DNA--protein-cysteine methyltransferase family protein [Bacillus sp. BGMRC 2118]|nr:methylphosphotriester-DNA--protein-cysteine methyltransferase family protein [Bacillus sp. BGMRC 2118]
MAGPVQLSFNEMWERILACDKAYDGLFYTAVKTTKIYCRPSCRSRKPKKCNVSFYFDIMQVEEAGYRACKRCQPEVEYSPHTAIVQKVITYLASNYRKLLVLQDIADHVGVSSFYLERLFKEETSMTPRAYLEKIRVDKAVHLLKYTDKTSLEVCYEAGFQSTSNFYRVFKRIHHCKPGEYRDELRSCEDELAR